MVLQAAVVSDRGRYLLERVTEGSFLRGLWLFPFVEPPASLAGSLSRKLGVECELGPRLGSVKHAITFRRLTVEAFRIEPAVPLRLRGRKGFRWARLEELGKSVPVPSLALKLARRIIESAAAP